MYIVETPFKYAYEGIHVKEFEVGDLIEDGDACLKTAETEKWVRKLKKNEKPMKPEANKADDSGSKETSE